MYSGFSKDNGSIIGSIHGNNNLEPTLQESLESTNADETLVCNDEEGNEMFLYASINPSTGNLEWSSSYDINWVKCRTIAMSQMTSMLRDTDRNNVYQAAITKMIEYFKYKANRYPVVLDIGCGTGLLSLYSTRAGSQFTYAIEMFDSMAGIASEVTQLNNRANNGQNPNGESDDILVIHAKSSEVESLPVNADLLVSELLDSALLGECCIPSHRDAIERLMRDESDVGIPIQDRVIPNRGEVYATAIRSEEVHKMVSTEKIKENFNINVYRDDEAKECNGGWPLLPCHWEALEHRGSKKVSDSYPCLGVNFHHFEYSISSNGQFQVPKTYTTDIVINETGDVHGILVWWKVFLLSEAIDPTCSFTYSTAPGAQNWQDHWQQCIFPLPKPIYCNQGEILRVYASHDDLQIWFKVEKLDTSLKVGLKRSRDCEAKISYGCMLPQFVLDESYCKETCKCGWHVLNPSDRFLMLNDKNYSQVWQNIINEIIQYSKVQISLTNSPFQLMDLSDASLISLKSAFLARINGLNGDQFRVITKESKLFSRLFLSSIVDNNDLNEWVCLWDGDNLSQALDYFNDDETKLVVTPDNYKMNALVSEIFHFQTSTIPTFQALMFHYQRTFLNNFLAPNAIIVPSSARVMILPLELPNLKNCHGTVGTVSTFDHTPLDNCQSHWHTFYYPYRIANYKKRALSTPHALCYLNYAQTISPIRNSVEITMESDGSCDGFAIWVDYELNSSNLLTHYNNGDFPPYLTLSVKFNEVSKQVRAGDKLTVNISFTPSASDFEYEYIWH